MKKFITLLSILFTLAVSAQEVASTSVTSKQQWFFAGQTIKVDASNNKTLTTSWVKKDSATGIILKTDYFSHSDTNFNTFWDGYDGFTSLVNELAAAEGLTITDTQALEDSFYNKHVARRALPVFPRPIKK